MIAETIVLSIRLVSTGATREDGHGEDAHVHVYDDSTLGGGRKLGEITSHQDTEGNPRYRLRKPGGTSWFEPTTFGRRDDALLALLRRHGLGLFGPRQLFQEEPHG